MNDIEKLKYPNSWYYENGYLTIDLELFGRNLCELFNKFLGEYYDFQKFTPTIRTDKERPIWQQGEESRYLAIISPNLYDEKSIQNYNRVREVHMVYPRPYCVQDSTLCSKEYPSMFSKEPLILGEKEFLLYFGVTAHENLKVSLGYIENCDFVPSASVENFRISSSYIGNRECSTTKPKTSSEIYYSNLQYPFVEAFIKEIFYYKVTNLKPNLNQNDMTNVNKNFKIHTRRS